MSERAFQALVQAVAWEMSDIDQQSSDRWNVFNTDQEAYERAERLLRDHGVRDRYVVAEPDEAEFR